MLFAAIVVGGAYLTWKRVAPGDRGRVWAEDGNIFLGQALESGPVAVLFQGYAGYQHLIPRLVVAGLLPVLNLASYPVVVFAICSVATGLAAAVVFWVSRDMLPWLPARLTVGLITLTIPLAAQETIGNLADLHTYAMWLAPWLLLYRPRSWWTSAGWAVVMFALVMTEIQILFFLFLVPFRLRGRDRLQLPVFAALLIGGVAQISTAIAVERPPGNGPLSLQSTVMGWLINTVTPIVTADPALIRSWLLSTGFLAASLILIPVVAAAAACIIWGTPAQRLLTVALLLGSAAIYVGSAWANNIDVLFMYAEEDLSYLGIRLVLNIRYGVASGMMLVAVIPIAASVVVHRFNRKSGIRIFSLTACALLIATLAHGSSVTASIRDQVPPWSPAVDEAVRTCSADKPPQRVTLPVAPDRSVDLECADVLKFSAGQRIGP